MPAIATRTATTVAVKSYRPAPQLSEETEAFAANIYLDGKRAGYASNSGHGGCNRYGFDSREQQDAFFAYAEQWGEDTGETFEPADALIASLCENIELTKQARKFVKSGAAAVIFIEKTPCWFGDRAGKPDYYEDCYLLGLPAGRDPAAAAVSEGAEQWRVISTD